MNVFFIIADQFNDNITYVRLEYDSISLSIALFFFMDILLRLFVEG